MIKNAEGIRSLRAKDYEGAVSALTEAISLEPGVFVAAYGSRAEAYQHLGRHREARADRHAIASIPGSRLGATSAPNADSEQFLSNIRADAKRNGEVLFRTWWLASGSWLEEPLPR